MRPVTALPLTARPVTIRPVTVDSIGAARDLLDRCFGVGFGHIDDGGGDVAYAAYSGPFVVGVVTASLRDPAGLETFYRGRLRWPADGLATPEVALLGQIAVDAHARRCGVGDALLDAVEQAVFERFDGRIDYWVANAWVHARNGHCPAGPLFERHGFALAGNVPDFFAAMPADDCPGCGHVPCRCSANVYIKHR